VGRAVGWFFAVTCVGGLLLLSPGAQAEPSAPPVVAEPVVFEVDSPTGCTDAAAFLRAVQARTRRVRESEGGAGERRFKLSVRPFAAGFEGRLSVVAGEREGGERRIGAPTCHEVVAALALIAALAIDPDTLTAPVGSFSEPAAPSPDVPNTPAETRPPPSADGRAPVGTRVPVVRDIPIEGRSTPRESPSPATFAAGVSFGANADPARPLVFPTGALVTELSLDARRVLSPRFRLGARASLPASVTSASGFATFTLIGARAEGCPVTLTLTARADLVPCVLADGGVVRASGDSGRGTVSRTRPYWGAGVVSRVEWDLGSADFELELGVSRPLVRDRWSFSPGETIYEAPDLLVFAAVGSTFTLLGEAD
jgi:hypothetical protein